jgi:hypothetical protein
MQLGEAYRSNIKRRAGGYERPTTLVSGVALGSYQIEWMVTTPPPVAPHFSRISGSGNEVTHGYETKYKFRVYVVPGEGRAI